MSKYAFFLGQNGGGSDGNFAIIKIDYPDDTQVYVEHEGEVIEAPSTKGPWMFGCDEAGLYKVGIDGTDISQEIEITFKGQIESTFVSPQIINYALIYHLGNEFANPSEDELRYSIKTGGWNIDNGTPTIKANAQSLYTAGYKTRNNIDTNGFSKFFIYFKGFRLDSLSETTNAGTGYNSASYGSINNQFLDQTLPKTNWTKYFLLGNKATTNLPIMVCSSQVPRLVNYEYRTNTKESNHLYMDMSCSGSSSGSAQTRLYSIGFCKEDDISGLSNYGTTISQIISNATSLFNDSSAVSWMANNCSGDFMISALSNTNFVNAMNSSPNKIILTANEHWARFIALLSV